MRGWRRLIRSRGQHHRFLRTGLAQRSYPDFFSRPSLCSSIFRRAATELRDGWPRSPIVWASPVWLLEYFRSSSALLHGARAFVIHLPDFFIGSSSQVSLPPYVIAAVK